MPLPFSQETRSVVLTSDYSLAESIERLHAVIVPSGFDAETTESVMGSVTEQHVRLEHNIPWSSSVDRPHFVGSFQESEQRVSLSGHFIMSRHSDFSISNKLLLVLFPFWLVAAVRNPQAWFAPLIVLFFFWMGRDATKRHERRFQQGAEWLSAYITCALTVPPPNHALQRTGIGGEADSDPRA